ncbi:GH25 family lysozyme [Capnocytophaga stomatis]|uniref:GH25 family lysozyme n=1 Tax=Capnocytophaga stomatis TaxID=1848904 RepID=A0ABW8Q9J7_9FLAO
MKKRRKISVQRKKRSSLKNVFLLLFLLLLGAGIGGVLYVRHYYPAHYQKIINKISSKKKNTIYERQRIEQIINRHKDKTFGIDLSHYQEKEDIVWDSLHLNKGAIRLEFAIFRATMGNNTTDKNFPYFWKKAKKHKLIRGAYHYYRPDEDPVLQANSYIKVVNLEKGDFLPILDVEKLPKHKTKQQYLEDIQIWLDIVEKKYGVKPIIYTYISFYEDYLYGKFKKYPLWIANYNNVPVPTSLYSWKMWQFTENGITPGSKVKIDLNIYNGNREKMKEILIF